MRNYIVLILSIAAFTASGCKKKAEAIISADKTQVLVNETVQFTNTTENAETYEWDFGDDQSSTEASPSHSWSTAGTYNVTMTACPKQGHGPQQHFGGDKCDEASITITVTN
jgi:PKD repeat protein